MQNSKGGIICQLHSAIKIHKCKPLKRKQIMEVFMNQQLTEIVCVIDKSGSMQSIASVAIEGFNALLLEQQDLPGFAKLTLVLFDDTYDVVYSGLDIKKAKPLNEKTYIPDGSTALLDAIGKTIEDLGKRLSDAEEIDRPGKVIFAILTDGYENSSQEFNYKQIATMIKHQKNIYNWNFLFLAANQDAVASAANLSIKAENAIDFQITSEGVKGVCFCLSKEITQRRKTR